jgi:hypothetical protein
MSLHDQIMNLPDRVAPEGESDAFCRGFKFGHKAARHAAAELALAADAEIERMRAELNAMDKALRCEGWPLAARLERAEKLAAEGAELTDLKRWRSTNAPRLEALQGLLETAQREAAAGAEAIATLASEREANAILTGEVEALRKDAERYRKLRDGAFVAAPMVVDPFKHDVTYTPEGLDAALDALP